MMGLFRKARASTEAPEQASSRVVSRLESIVDRLNANSAPVPIVPPPWISVDASPVEDSDKQPSMRYLESRGPTYASPDRPEEHAQDGVRLH